MNHYYLFLILLFFHFPDKSYAQIKIGGNSLEPAPSAILELESTNQGFLPPRMTTDQRDAIDGPLSGMIIFNTSLNCLQVYSEGEWTCMVKNNTATYPPRLAYEEILALPAPQGGDLAFDLTFQCLRFYNGSKWVSTSNPAGDISPEVKAWKNGGAGYNIGEDITVDGSGNVYVTGAFDGTANFGTSSFTSSGNYDVFIVKYSNSGEVKWALKAGGSNYDYSSGIAVDANNNVYVTGYFNGSITFGNILLTSTGSADMFVVKYNSNGEVIWAQKGGGTEYDYSYGLAVDGSGNVYVTGSFVGTANFGTSSLNPNTNNRPNMFVVKYNTNGEVLWAQKEEGSNYIYISGIALDARNNVYVTGYFYGSIYFNSNSVTSNGNNDLFVVKYDGNGVSQWAQKGGGSLDDISTDIAVDAEGNVYVIGYFNGTARLGAKDLTSSGSFDIFVVKYTSSGMPLWSHQGGGTASDFGHGLAVDGSGNVFITGSFENTAAFGINSYSTSGDSDIFVVKYNTNGMVQWTRKGGGPLADQGRAIAVDSKGNVYVTGSFSTTATFGSSTITSTENTDVYIARYKE